MKGAERVHTTCVLDVDVIEQVGMAEEIDAERTRVGERSKPDPVTVKVVAEAKMWIGEASIRAPTLKILRD